MKKNPILLKAIITEIARAEKTLRAIEKLRGPSGKQWIQEGQTMTAYDEIEIDLENLQKDLKSFNTNKPVQNLRDLHVLRFTRNQLREKLLKIEEAEDKARARAKKNKINEDVAIAEDATLTLLRNGEENIRRNILKLEKYAKTVSEGSDSTSLTTSDSEKAVSLK